jgi:hypothetical protein
MAGIFALGLWLLSRLWIHASDWIGQHYGGRENICSQLKQAQLWPPSETLV